MTTPSDFEYPILLPSDALNVAAIIPRAHIHGPGDRFVIWLQGCAIRCRGCWNEKMWVFKRNRIVAVAELESLVLREQGISGVTILGGEPLHQRRALIPLVRRLRERGLTTVLYTGFELEELTDSDSIQLVSLTEITICGRYDQTKRSTNLRWRGSSNQRVIVPASGQWIEGTPDDGENEVEIQIEEDGQITVLGYPEQEILQEARRWGPNPTSF